MINDPRTLATKFKQDGVLSPIQIFTDQEIQKFQKSFREFENNVEQKREDYENLHFHAAWAREMATHPKLLNLIEAIIGPEVLIYGSLVLSKIPGKNTHLSWHQDQYFMPQKENSPYITAWMALTDSTVQNGCMKVIPGSHKKGLLPHLPFEKDDTNMLTSGVEIKIQPDPKDVFNVELKPSQISLHDGAMIHSSFHNLTNQNRVGFIVRYVSPNISETRNPVLQPRGQKEVSNLVIYNKPAHEAATDAAKSYSVYEHEKASRLSTK